MATLSVGATGSGGGNVTNVEKITTSLGSEDIVCLQSGSMTRFGVVTRAFDDESSSSEEDDDDEEDAELEQLLQVRYLGVFRIRVPHECISL